MPAFGQLSKQVMAMELCYPVRWQACVQRAGISGRGSTWVSLGSRRSSEWEFGSQKLSRQCWWPLQLGTMRCALETQQYVEGKRKCAPSLLEGAGSEAGDAQWRVVPDIWRTSALKYGDRVALVDPHHHPPSQMTFNQLEQAILDFAEGLRVSGIQPEQTVALFADNSHRWLISDQGIMAAGAVDAVRGSRSSAEELLHIYSHSDSAALVIDNAELFNKLAPHLKTNFNIKFVVLLWGAKSSLCNDLMKHIPIYTYDELLAIGHTSRQALSAAISSGETMHYDVIQSDDVATLVYTSGTTGNPKGVMLTHSNLLHQVINLWSVIQPAPGDRFLSLLPPWHMYERSLEYFSLSRGINHVYTNVKTMKVDLVLYPPDYFVSVPLVLDLLYSGVQKQLAAATGARKALALGLISMSLKYMDARRIYEGRDLASTSKRNPLLVAAALQYLVARTVAALLLPLHLLAKKLVYSKIRAALGMRQIAISGGGSLPSHVDKFLEAIGISVLNGYGLTETSPVLACRLAHKNILGTVGLPIPGTEIKIVDPETGCSLPPGNKGLVKARGPQLMKGYYKNDAATRKTIDEDGWLDTGDLGWVAPELTIGAARSCGGTLVLDGRAKDTIVLSTGENVEPTEIEEAVMESNLINQIVVVGQDQRRIGALIVVNKDELYAAAARVIEAKGGNSEPSLKELKACIHKDLKTYGSTCSHQIGPNFAILFEPFTIENGLLTPTMKVRRDVVASQYKDEIISLYK